MTIVQLLKKDADSAFSLYRVLFCAGFAGNALLSLVLHIYGMAVLNWMVALLGVFCYWLMKARFSPLVETTGPEPTSDDPELELA